jgi:hypothetical protein
MSLRFLSGAMADVENFDRIRGQLAGGLHFDFLEPEGRPRRPISGLVADFEGPNNVTPPQIRL